MKYYIINTDKRSFEGMNNISVWLENDLAFTGGPTRYLDELAKLEVGDICLMYENEIVSIRKHNLLNLLSNGAKSA